MATDLQSDFLLLFLMPGKSAESVLAALDELRAFVRGIKPGVRIEVFWGDNDTAWVVTGQGDTRTTAAVSRWLAALPEEQGAGFALSAPYSHQHVDVLKLPSKRSRLLYNLFVPCTSFVLSLLSGLGCCHIAAAPKDCHSAEAGALR